MPTSVVRAANRERVEGELVTAEQSVGLDFDINSVTSP